MSAEATTGRVAVVAVRHDDRRVLYGHYLNRDTADAIVKALARVGLKAELATGIDPSVRPGTNIATKADQVSPL